MINNDDINVCLTGSVARRQMHDLHAAADTRRLAKAYRDAHPELRLRRRMAGWLRRTADRLARRAGPPAARTAGRPSPAPR